MVVYLILYGAGVLFASSVHYYMSGMSLILAALYLYFYDYRRSGNPFHLRALFSLFWVGGEGISCFKLSRLQTDWDPVTWASFFIALAAFWSVFGLAEARIRKKREEGKDKREEKARRKGVEAVSEGTEAAGSFGRLTAILLLTAVSWAAFLLEAAVLGYVPFFLRGVPHAYSHFHISGVHYFTVSCVLVPSMAVIWFLRGGVKKRWQAVLVLLAAAASLLVPVLCVQARTVQHLAALQKCLALLERIRQEVAFRRADLQQLYAELCREGILESGARCLQEAPPPEGLTREEQQCFRTCMSGLGRAEAQRECEQLDYYRARLQALQQTAEHAARRQAGLPRKLGLAAGMAMALLLI